MRSFTTLFFTAASMITVHAQLSGPRPIVRTQIPGYALATVMDINGDGFKDMAVGSTDKGVGHFMNDGAQHFGEVQWDDTTTACDLLVSGDMDNDGDLDVIGVESNEHAFCLLNNGGVLAPAMEIV